MHTCEARIPELHRPHARNHHHRVGGWRLPTIESNGAGELAERVELMLDYLDPVEMQAGWGGCVLSAVGLVSSIVSISPIGAVASAWSVGCECTPLLDEEFAEIECPFF